MGTALITGSAGLIGSESARHFADAGLDVVGIDNDMRRVFFGAEASTSRTREELQRSLGRKYRHRDIDVRDRDGVERLVKSISSDLALVVHTAAQPSHDWAARDPLADFDINAGGTLNVLEAVRRYAPDATFIFTSTNKVYGDRPNTLPLVECETRYEIDPSHRFAAGIDESMSIDETLHSLFGASKVSADVLVQEYGRYFGLRTACFRGGTLTGPAHAATELHGFLGYVMRCAMTGRTYRIFGYKGKQVRDAIHSNDLVAAFGAFFANPGVAQVYNIGGGRHSNISVLEAIAAAEAITGRPVQTEYDESNRTGDHIWWVGSNRRFEEHYPEWSLKYDTELIMREIYEVNKNKWCA